ncbi:MAG TPA: hypothetical protein VJO16_08170 [Candidatus Acidoferrum sp.]|nr:hypothetical protein [Candidatus Acidoferrum sp.]
MRRFLIFSASLALFPVLTFAQGRGMASGAGHFAAPARSAISAPRFAMRSAPMASARFSSAPRTAPAFHYVRTRSGAIVARPISRGTARLGTARSGRAIRSEDVPGLGFDYAHLAAIHPRGSRGHGRGHNHGFVAGYFPFYGGAYYWPLYPDEVDDESAANNAPQVDQQEGEEPPPAETEAPLEPAAVTRDYAPQPPPAPPQTEEYVFVRRDGTLFFATAFAWEHGTLRYISREGISRTLSLDQIDLHATQQFNQQRGLNFTMPA